MVVKQVALDKRMHEETKKNLAGDLQHKRATKSNDLQVILRFNDFLSNLCRGVTDEMYSITRMAVRYWYGTCVQYTYRTSVPILKRTVPTYRIKVWYLFFAHRTINKVGLTLGHCQLI